MLNLIIIIVSIFAFIIYAKITETKKRFDYLDYCLIVTFVMTSLISFIDLIFA